MALRTKTSALKLAGALAAAIMLTACGSTKKATNAFTGGDKAQAAAINKEYRDAIGVYSSLGGDMGMDPIASAAFWGTRYNTDQSDPNIAVKFSHSLRKIGSTAEAASVMQKAITQHEDNPEVSLEYGKVLVESGRAFEAVRHLENAVAKKPTDWTAVSAYGVALDQIGEHKQARNKYNRALSLAPGSVSILNNKGLSYAMDGDLSSARATLQKAAAGAGGDARIRQNLALVLALSGDMQGAERLARSDLPPIVANNNIDFFRQLMNQPAYWGEYAATNAEVPSFDETAPAAPLKKAPRPNEKLLEEPKPEDGDAKSAPVALVKTAPVTNVSLEELLEPVEADDDADDDDQSEGAPLK